MTGCGLVDLSGVVIQVSVSSVLDLVTQGQPLTNTLLLMSDWQPHEILPLTTIPEQNAQGQELNHRVKFFIASSLLIAANAREAAYI